jgi:hypothetical protein
MIMISSKAGQRLAKAKAAQDAAAEAFQVGETQGLHYSYLQSRLELVKAAEAVADELVADGHHEAKGD